MTNLTPTTSTNADPTLPLYIEDVPEGAVIEWYAAKHTNGCNTNDPIVRHVGKVTIVRTGYVTVQPANGFDAHSRVRLYQGTPVTILAEKAEAGWAKLA